MLVRDYISKDYHPAQANEFCKDVLQRMLEFQFNHIPVLNGFEFKGAIPFEVLKEMPKDTKIQDFQFEFHQFYAKDNVHVLETPKLFEMNETNLLPVLDQEGHYMGYFSIENFVNTLETMPWSAEPGVIILLEINNAKYSGSEIAQIVEGENARILGFFLSEYRNQEVQITVKVTNANISALLKSFERFGYRILSRIEDDHSSELLQERYDQLIRFLEI